MQYIKTNGVVSSIVANKKYIYVSYFDNTCLDIFSKKDFSLIKNIETRYMHTYQNILTINNKYVIFVEDGNIINLLSTESNHIELSFKIHDPCGAINRMDFLNENNIVITTNKAVGNHDTRKDVFIYNIPNSSLKSFNSSTFIKNSICHQDHIFLFGTSFKNNKDVPNLTILNESLNIIKEDELLNLDGDHEIIDTSVYASDHGNSDAIFIKTDQQNISVYLSENSVHIEKLDHQLICGFIGNIGKLEIFNKNNENMIECNFLRNSSFDALKNSVITGAIFKQDDAIILGVDRKIAFFSEFQS